MNISVILSIVYLVFLVLYCVDCKSLHNLRNKRTFSDTNNLILISFDGFRWDYLENVTLPNMNEYFVNDGVKINKGLINVFPTVTYPNHWTLATGLYPQFHGMVANVMYDPDLNETFYAYGSSENETKWYGQNNQTVPIWILNQLEGGKSAIIGHFPGAFVPFQNRTVDYFYDYDNKMDWPAKVDKLIEIFMNDNKTNFGVLYFVEPDETGHEFGPYSEETHLMLLKCDQVVGYLIKRLKEVGLFDYANIIITSDHGMDMASLDNSIDLNDRVNLSTFKAYGGLTNINIFPKTTDYGELIYSSLSNLTNYKIYRKKDLPVRFQYSNNSRIAPLVMYGDVGFEIFAQNRKEHDWSKWKGDHGTDNQVSSMHPVFIARGPRFKQNYSTDSKIQSVEIYNLMCYLLDLRPQSNNGSFHRVAQLIRMTAKRLRSFDSAGDGVSIITYNNLRQNEIDFKLNAKLNEISNQIKQSLRNYSKILFVLIFLLIFVLVVQFYSNQMLVVVMPHQSDQLKSASYYY